MKRFNKAYIIEIDGIEFTVREYAPRTPLLFLRLEHEPDGHLFHLDGFDRYCRKYDDLSGEFANEVKQAFDKCQKYLDTRENIFDGNENIKSSYKEYF